MPDTIVGPFSRPVEDHELAARAENARLWWRRAIMLCLIVLIASPLSAAVVWWARLLVMPPVDFDPPGAHASMMRSVYVDYARHEGYANRGRKFATCLTHLQAFAGHPGNARGAFTEAEVLYYLGPPDETLQTSGGTGLIYYYAQHTPRDMRAIVSITTNTGQRELSNVNLTASPPPPRNSAATSQSLNGKR